MRSWKTVLKKEFDAEDGSFLLRLRGDLVWDEAAYERLAEAMESCCDALKPEYHTLKRWIAVGFFNIYYFVRGHTFHAAFPRPLGDAYYSERCDRLEELVVRFYLEEVEDE